MPEKNKNSTIQVTWTKRGSVSRQIEGFLCVFALTVSKMEMDGGFGPEQFVLWRGAKRIVVGEDNLQTSKISSVFKVSQLI